MKFVKWISLQPGIYWNARSGLLWVIGFLVLQGSCKWSGPPTIMLTAEEFRFSPTRIEWESDQPLRLLIRNQGRERHVFHSQELFGPDANILWHQPRIALQETNAVVLEPGQSIELFFTASAGLYPFRCWIKGHTGMEGTILIKDLSSS
ncbi:cupredoxin domain-containing protein [Nitrospira sp. Ecomares 2.1]